MVGLKREDAGRVIRENFEEKRILKAISCLSILNYPLDF